MRKIKLTLQCRVPSWNFCNSDAPTKDLRYSKELCRFCVKTKTGYHCMLHDESLKADKDFIYKPTACIDATAGFAITVDEPTPVGPTVDPKLIIRETLKTYTQALNDLLRQGYPREMAETLATKFTTGEI